MHVHCVSRNSFNIIHFNSTSKPEKTLKFPPIHSEIQEHTINGTVVGIDGIPFDFHNHCSLKRLTLNLIYEEVAAHLQFVVIVIISIFAFSNLSLNLATNIFPSQSPKFLPFICEFGKYLKISVCFCHFEIQLPVSLPFCTISSLVLFRLISN